MGISSDIRAKAFEILESSQDGIRFSELVKKIHEAIPNSNLNTINGSIWDLDKKNRDTVYKPAKGIFKLTKYRDHEEAVEARMIRPEDMAAEKTKTKLEESFYEPFRKWFVAELSDCDTAIVLGGSKSKIKWSNPDVLGSRKPEFKAIVKFSPEIVSAEIQKAEKNAVKQKAYMDFITELDNKLKANEITIEEWRTKRDNWKFE